MAGNPNGVPTLTEPNPVLIQDDCQCQQYLDSATCSAVTFSYQTLILVGTPSGNNCQAGPIEIYVEETCDPALVIEAYATASYLTQCYPGWAYVVIPKTTLPVYIENSIP